MSQRILYHHQLPYINGLAVHPTRPLLAVCGNRLVALFDLEQNKLCHTFEPHIQQELCTGFGCEFSASGEDLAVSYYGGIVEIFSVHDRAPHHHLQLMCGPPFGSRRVRYIPNSSKLCFIGTDGQLIVWDQETERIVWRYRSPHGSFCDVTLDRQGQRIFAIQTSWGEKNHLTIHEVETGIMTQIRMPSLMWAIACTADGSRFAVGGATGDVYLYDTTSVQELGLWSGQPVTSLRFTQDDHTLLALRTRDATLIDATTGVERVIWSDDVDSLYALATHPESKECYVAGLAGTLRALTLPEYDTDLQTQSFADASWPRK